MNQEEINKINYQISVQRAYLNGEQIQVRFSTNANDADWANANKPCWNWATYDFRVRTAPEELWINVYPNKLTAMHNSAENAECHKTRNCIRTIHYREVV